MTEAAGSFEVLMPRAPRIAAATGAVLLGMTLIFGLSIFALDIGPLAGVVAAALQIAAWRTQKPIYEVMSQSAAIGFLCGGVAFTSVFVNLEVLLMYLFVLSVVLWLYGRLAANGYRHV